MPGGGRQTDFVLELRLVGRMRLLRVDGVEITPKGRKAQGLLALLGVAPELRRHRSWLQDKLWSDRPPEQGAASLRQELAGIRRALGEWSGCLATDGGWVALDAGRVSVRLDPDPEDWELTGAPPEFVAGLDIADPEFEDWIRDQRAVVAERLARLPQPDAMPAAPAPAPLESVASEEPPPSIAIMPLTLLTESGEGGVVATGLVLDVIGRLTRFRRLDAIAYASTAALAPLGLTPREIGRRLGVRYVTQGALWFGRSRLRVSVDLIEASGERVLWSEQFDGAFDDVFEIEGEVASLLTAGLMVEIDKQERARVRARNPGSLDAYELCLRGLDEMLRIDRAGCDNALAYFTRAAEREQGYARALSGISRAHGFYWKYRWTDEREAALARADEFALRAVDSDVNDASANAALGWVALYSRNHDRSLASYGRAMELNPSDADILAEHADALSHCGLNDRAIPLFERAIRLNPQMSDIYSKDLAYTYLKAQQYEAAIKTIQSMRRPQIADIILTACLALAGHDEAARRAAEAVRRAHPGFSPDAWVTMVPDVNYDDTARYLEGLKRAGL
jgi:TolB-like protein